MKRAQDPDLSAAQMQLLWVGNNDKGFAYLRDVLTRSGEERLGLDRVGSPEEALQRLNQTTQALSGTLGNHPRRQWCFVVCSPTARRMDKYFMQRRRSHR
jgi:hypothetical protein